MICAFTLQVMPESLDIQGLQAILGWS